MSNLPVYEARWQPAPASAEAAGPTATVRGAHYMVRLVDGSTLELPLRPLPGGDQAIALLMSNQTAFAVEDALRALLVRVAAPLAPDVIVGMPTMGLDYARLAARDLGHADYVALGLSRKFWYRDELSEPVCSATSPGQAKSVYLDPALVARLAGRRTLIVDDVINTGASAVAALRLVRRAGAQVVGILAALTEGHAWRQELAQVGPEWPGQVHALGHIPMFERTATGEWQPIAATE